MSENSPTSTINLQEVTTRADMAQHIITGFSRAMPRLWDFWQEISDSLSDIPILAVEITRLGSELRTVRLDRANLAAWRVGEPDPLSYLCDELDAQGFTAGQRGRP